MYEGLEGWCKPYTNLHELEKAIRSTREEIEDHTMKKTYFAVTINTLWFYCSLTCSTTLLSILDEMSI